jgi:hypothetical protein
LSDTRRLVSGRSGRPVNVVESLDRSMGPVRVNGNGAGNASVSDRLNPEPVRYAIPISGLGYSGELAVTEPTDEQVPLETLGHRSAPAPRLGNSGGCGKRSVSDLLGGLASRLGDLGR